MDLAERLRQFREYKHLSQGDIEKRTGLLRCYISRVENGHTTPSLETLEKITRALNVPMYHLFYEAEGAPDVTQFSSGKHKDGNLDKRVRRTFTKLHRAISRMSDKDRKIVMVMATQMANGRSSRKS